MCFLKVMEQQLAQIVQTTEKLSLLTIHAMPNKGSIYHKHVFVVEKIAT